MLSSSRVYRLCLVLVHVLFARYDRLDVLYEGNVVFKRHDPY